MFEGPFCATTVCSPVTDVTRDNNETSSELYEEENPDMRGCGISIDQTMGVPTCQSCYTLCMTTSNLAIVPAIASAALTCRSRHSHRRPGRPASFNPRILDC